MSFRSLVITLTGSFLGRLSWSFFCAKALVETTPNIAITRISLTNLIIFTLSSSCQCSRAREGERDAPHKRQQERCHVILAVESIRNRRKSHGFAFSRTLSCSRRGVRKATKRQKMHKRFRRRGQIRLGVRFSTNRLLTSYSDAHRADVAAGVEGSQRDRMLAGSE